MRPERPVNSRNTGERRGETGEGAEIRRVCRDLLLLDVHVSSPHWHREMDDTHQSIICSAITKVLPDLSASILDITEETLQLLGVETTEDFHFIQETDLLSVRRTIQARTLLAAWIQTAQSSEINTESPLASPSSSICSSFFASPVPSCPIAAIDWVDSFQIPWRNFPEELMYCFEREKRPKPWLRTEMILCFSK